MAEQDLIKAARGVVDAFNAGDWEACKAALTSDSVYDEIGTSRRILADTRSRRHHTVLAGLEAGHARREGHSQSSFRGRQHRGT